MKPNFLMGPAAVPSSQFAANSYGLFTCQVAGLTPGVACYDPYEMRHAYGTDQLIKQGFDGTGKTIVIIDSFQSPNVASELSTFDNFYGIPAPPSFKIVTPDGQPPTAFDATNGDEIGWANEITLDVEWSHAIAPGANIVLVLARSDQNSDIYAAQQYAVNNHLGDVISQSFGEDEACMGSTLLDATHQVFARATRQGMTIFASAGDDGAAQVNCDGTAYVEAVSSPAVDPLVTAVGGTTLQAAYYLDTQPAGTYESESVWDEPDGSGGGGFSLLYSEPSYQQGTLNGGKHAGVPDVSYNAAVYHGVLAFLNVPGETAPSGSWYLFGGTSAGSPQWSAIIAMADEKNGKDLGYINTALYHIGHASPLYAASFHDITTGNNAWATAGYAAGPGWDAASGYGTPKAPELVNLLIQFVSPGDATAAMAQSAAKSAGSAKAHVTPH